MKLVYIGLGVYLLKMKEIILVISWHYNKVKRLIVTKKNHQRKWKAYRIGEIFANYTSMRLIPRNIFLKKRNAKLIFPKYH